MKAPKPDLNALELNINNAMLKLGEIASLVIYFELKMRIIGELSQPVRDWLKANNKPEYWEKDCNLSCLELAIASVFQLDPASQETLKDFRIARNKLLHGDFVSLLKELKIEPTSRELLPGGGREILSQEDMIEGINSMERNNGYTEFRKLANEANKIIEKIFKYLT